MLPDQQPTMQIPPMGGVHAKVEKGMAGKYGWSLSITLPFDWKKDGVEGALGVHKTVPAVRFDECLSALEYADAEMRKLFAPEATP